MFEFFEVPSQSMGAIGPVAQGMNFDWARQDTKPGLINLNLIIDEEVFFSVFGKQDQNFNQQLLNFHQLPDLRQPTMADRWAHATASLTLPHGRGVLAGADGRDRDHGQRIAGGRLPDALTWGCWHSIRLGSGLGNRMKAAFAQFLSLRHGGSGYVFGYGSGLPGQNATVLTGKP